MLKAASIFDAGCPTCSAVDVLVPVVGRCEGTPEGGALKVSEVCGEAASHARATYDGRETLCQLRLMFFQALLWNANVNY